MKRGPLNSLGKPWKGESWTCTACGETGPDRDDTRLSGCKAHPSGREWAPHTLTFHPPEHHAALVARGAA